MRKELNKLKNMVDDLTYQRQKLQEEKTEMAQKLDPLRVELERERKSREETKKVMEKLQEEVFFPIFFFFFISLFFFSFFLFFSFSFFLFTKILIKSLLTWEKK